MIAKQMQIHGIAVTPGISKNGILYTAEELSKFAPTLEGKPILKDHRSEVDNTVGLVQNTSSDIGGVQYEGWVKEDGTGLLEKIKDGRAKEVSIGAFVHRLVRDNDDDEHVRAIGIEGMELSITPTPGVTGTSLKQSLESIKKHRLDKKVKIRPILENVGSIKKYIKTESIKKVKEENKMAEEEQPVEQPVEEPVVEEPKTEEKPVEKEPEAAAAEKPATESVQKVTVEVDNSKLDETITKLKEIDQLKEKVSDKPVVEAKKVKEDSTKGKITEDVEDVKEDVTDLHVETCDYSEGASLWKEPKSDGSYI